jgi:hypothetical protein
MPDESVRGDNTLRTEKGRIQVAQPMIESDDPNTLILQISRIVLHSNSDPGFGQAA